METDTDMDFYGFFSYFGLDRDSMLMPQLHPLLSLPDFFAVLA